MLEFWLEGLMNLANVGSIITLCVGVLWGVTIGILPGLGGLVAIALMIPILHEMGPVRGSILMFATTASVTYGGSITAVLVNTPGSPENAATTFDGYPMTRSGQPLRALALAATSSVIGGFIGVISVVLLIPLLRMFVMQIGSAEYALLAITGIAIIGMLQAETRIKGLLSGLIGIMLSFVGYDPVTGYSRFSFGRIELMEGIQTVPALIGLFAVGEMLILFRDGSSIVNPEDISTENSSKQLFDGIKETFRNIIFVIRCALVGVVIGIIPGLGGSVANFLAYGQAQKTSKDPDSFGKGNPRGIIAPEAANNAKDGGALIPTVAFGIPGSAGMAIILGGIIILGFNPGPSMLENDLGIIFTMTWSLAFGMLVAAIIGLSAAKYLVKLTIIPSTFLVPFITILCLIGGYSVRNSFVDLIVVVVCGILGYFLKTHGFSPASLVVGLLLGRVAEQNIMITLQAYGFSFLTRPVSIFLIITLLFVIFWPSVQERIKKRKK